MENKHIYEIAFLGVTSSKEKSERLKPRKHKNIDKHRPRRNNIPKNHFKNKVQTRHLTT